MTNRVQISQHIKWILFLVFVMTAGVPDAISQSISISVGVPVSFTATAPLTPGDPIVTPYENVMGDVTVTPDGGNKHAFGKTWYVTVSKSTTNWHSSLLLDVRRDPTESKVINGTTYVQIPDDPSSSYFFESNNKKKVNNLDLQHRVRIVGAGPPAGTYSTTVTYTIVDM